jgi:hypothetical protein
MLSPGFQESSPGFLKDESGFSFGPGPGFSRVRIFFESESGSESESGPGFEVCPQLIKGVSTHLIALVFLLKLINDTLFVLWIGLNL